MQPSSSLRIECWEGTVLDFNAYSELSSSDIFDVGLIPKDAKMNTYCATVEEPALQMCQSYVDKTVLR